MEFSLHPKFLWTALHISAEIANYIVAQITANLLQFSKK